MSSNIVERYKLNDSFDSVECCFDIVAVGGNKVEFCFDKVERCFDNVACCFDIVAGVDGALVISGNTDTTLMQSNSPEFFVDLRENVNRTQC